MPEIWKNIPGYLGRYEVSDQGRVRSLDRTSSHYRKCGTPSLRFFKGKLLTPALVASGHSSVTLEKGRSQGVHRLVLLAFTGASPKVAKDVHINGVRDDNRLVNLRQEIIHA